MARLFGCGLVQLCCVVVSCLAAATGFAADVVVVQSPVFDASLHPWVIDRQKSGLEVSLVRPDPDPNVVRDRIREVANESSAYVVLVGSAPTFGRRATEGMIPTFELPTTISRQFGSTPTLVSDAPYGLSLGGELEMAVGRLPVRTAQELDVVVAKILASDHSTDFGPWRSRLELVGGVGGFGMMIDMAIESVSRSIVTSALPASVRSGVLYGSPGHQFFPSERSFQDSVLDRFATGSRFWVYAGHGQVHALDRVPATAAGVPVLDHESASRLASAAHPSVGLILACFSGAIDGPPLPEDPSSPRIDRSADGSAGSASGLAGSGDCLAAAMLRQPGGPVAIIAGSRVTMPYGNSTLSMRLIDAVYGHKSTTLGQAWRETITSMRNGTPIDSPTAKMVDSLAAIVSPAAKTRQFKVGDDKGDELEERNSDDVDIQGDVRTAVMNPAERLAAEMSEHAMLYNLLGDPTMKLFPAGNVLLETSLGVDAGDPIELRITSPIAGTATVTIDVPLGTPGLLNPNQTSVASYEFAVRGEQTITRSIDTTDLPQGWLTIRMHVEGIPPSSGQNDETPADEVPRWATGAARVHLRDSMTATVARKSASAPTNQNLHRWCVGINV